MLHQVQQVCDRMAIFVDGRVVAEGTAEELAAGVDRGTSVYEIVASTDEEGLKRLIEPRFGVVSRVSPGRWRITLPASEVGELLRVIVDADVPLRQFRDLGMDLELIYARYFESPVGVGS
jgi:ABC-2 type transport system ATP-binding protein